MVSSLIVVDLGSKPAAQAADGDAAPGKSSAGPYRADLDGLRGVADGDTTSKG